MEKLICCFVLLSSLFCGIASASSCNYVSLTNEELQELTEVDPYTKISDMFKKGYGNSDYRDKDEIITVPRLVSRMYPNRPDLQRKAVDAWGQCMKEQKINGKRKYANRDADILVNFCKKKLDLN